MRTPTPARSALGHIAMHCDNVSFEAEHVKAARVASERMVDVWLHHIEWSRRACYDMKVEGGGEELRPVRAGRLYGCK